jgi:hypothetical protein
MNYNSRHNQSEQFFFLPVVRWNCGAPGVFLSLRAAKVSRVKENGKTPFAANIIASTCSCIMMFRLAISA